MSNIIDSIQLSGSSYDVRDKSATTVVEITQSEYDNLPSSAKTSNILYIITDGNDYYITSAQCQTQIDNSISGKQDTLSAGTGIDITDNVISCTGGGGGGVTTGEVQTMIDESISGKVDTTTYTAYTASTDTALSGKQETLVSGTNIKTINNQSLLGPGNIDIQGGGTGGTAVEEMTQAEYDEAASAGTLDAETLYIITDAPEINANEYVSKAENTVSATPIYYHYLDNYSDNSWPSKNAKMAILDFRGDKATTNYKECSITIYDATTYNWYYVYLYLDYTTGTFTKSDDYSIINAEYDSSIEDFKFSLSDNYPNCYIRNIGFCCENNYIIIPSGKEIASGQTARVIETSISDIFGDLYTANLNNVYYVGLTAESDKFRIYFNKNNGSQESSSNVNLEELKIDTNTYTLKPDIKIPLGVSGWTNCLTDNGCYVYNLPSTVFRISGDTSDMGIWSFQLEVHVGNNSTWDGIYWDGVNFYSSSGWFDATAITLNFDSQNSALTVTYPATSTIFGSEMPVVIKQVSNGSCAYNNIITGFDCYTELQQPIKSYVQDTKQDLGGLKLVKLTESEYTALVNKDANTLYVVTPDPNS